MIAPGSAESALMALVRAIGANDDTAASRLLAESPTLAAARIEEGATRQAAKAHYLDEIQHYLYGGIPHSILRPRPTRVRPREN